MNIKLLNNIFWLIRNNIVYNIQTNSDTFVSGNTNSVVDEINKFIIIWLVKVFSKKIWKISDVLLVEREWKKKTFLITKY